MKNKGTGTFAAAAAVNYSVNQPSSVAFGDVDADGDLDIVVGNYSDNAVSVLKNNGNGVFASFAAYAAGANGYIQAISLADINVDGNVDIVVAVQVDSDAVIDVLLNNGNGTFGLPLSYFIGTDPQAIAVADFDGSGKPDIAASLGRVVGVLFAVDTKPAAFSFTPQTGVTVNTVVTSNSVTISRINTGTPISVTGGKYSINGGVFKSVAGQVFNGDTVRVRLTSSGSPATKKIATLTIGGVKREFSVTTE